MFDAIIDFVDIIRNLIKSLWEMGRAEFIQNDPEELDTIKFKEETDKDQVELDGIIFMDKNESKLLKDKITNELKDLVEIVNIVNVEKVKRIELKGLGGINIPVLSPDYSKDIPPQEPRPKIKGIDKTWVGEDDEFDYYIDYEEEKDNNGEK